MFMVLGFVEGAGAIPFEIGTGGTLTSNVTFGALNYSYEALGSSFDLDEGQTSETIGFFNLNILYAFASGTLQAGIELLSPPPPVTLGEDGDFWVVGLFNQVGGSLTWGDPLNIAYGNLGTGLLTLDLNDLQGINIGCGPLVITGQITNVHNPVAEPATMLMLGCGLLGVAAFGSRKFYKKG